ncbi:centrosomal AT-AC splicing factor isoform X2 [Hydra vulgaris]|uniref:Centrosomal AT-AC splicing factor isoform X2 n=2 Tax=Hydra vulgaris TaxID=6087 RepID=A0ABM4C3B8_HYDVU
MGNRSFTKHLIMTSYSYCNVCRINHTLGKKHNFTKKHKLALKILIEKFGKKISECYIYFQNPVIFEAKSEDESSMTVWCHFCKTNCIKHVTDKFKTILYGGIFEHLSSEKHWKSTDEFWITNSVDQKEKSTFLISMADMLLYKKKLVPLVEQFEIKEIARTLDIANSIKVKEKNNLAICSSFKISSDNVVYKTEKNKFGILQNPLGIHQGVRVWRGGIVKYKMNSDQIIQTKYTQKNQVEIKFNTVAKNVHTGAVPPWLCNDECDQSSQMGPSTKEFEDYIIKTKKRKLNPNRVGAKFDHKTDEIQKDWLPSFGRVWTSGPRWKSRNEFKDKDE